MRWEAAILEGVGICVRVGEGGDAKEDVKSGKKQYIEVLEVGAEENEEFPWENEGILWVTLRRKDENWGAQSWMWEDLKKWRGEMWGKSISAAEWDRWAGILPLQRNKNVFICLKLKLDYDHLSMVIECLIVCIRKQVKTVFKAIIFKSISSISGWEVLTFVRMHGVDSTGYRKLLEDKKYGEKSSCVVWSKREEHECPCSMVLYRGR